VKLIFGSLDTLLTELALHKATGVRVCRAVQRESGTTAAGVPRLTSRIIVTAGLEENLWAEARFWVGRAIAESGPRGLRLPTAVEHRGDEERADITHFARARAVNQDEWPVARAKGSATRGPRLPPPGRGGVGHEPHLSAFISLCLTKGTAISIQLRKGGVARLVFAKRFQVGRGTLTAILPPRLLRSLR
jgi:hypothetical protein